MRSGKIIAGIMASAITFTTCLSFAGSGVTDKPEKVFAADIWDGSGDISWYDSGKKEFHISTGAELYGLSYLVEQGETMGGKTIWLDDDIYINDVSNFDTWELAPPINPNTLAIGLRYNQFSGTFYGRGHTIYGLYSSELFRRVTSSAVISDLNIAKSYICDKGGSSAIGLLANINDGRINNCSVEGICKHEGIFNPDEIHVGGVVGENTGVITGCSFKGTVSVKDDYDKYNGRIAAICGGICGDNTGSIYNCKSGGDISCSVAGFKQQNDFNHVMVGGICGRTTGQIVRCEFDGTVYGHLTNRRGYCAAAGISAFTILTSVTISNCAVKGKITSNFISGGICGRSGKSVSISECCNYADIEGSDAGGIIAAQASGETVNCFNRGDVNASSRGVGIAGGSAKINNVYNTGYVTTKEITDNDDNSLLNCFYEISPNGNNSNKGSAGRTAEQMKSEAFVKSLGSAFKYVPGDYPVLVDAGTVATDPPIEPAKPVITTTTTTTAVTTTTTTTTTASAGGKPVLAGDVNGNGKVNNKDMTILTNFLINKSDEITCSENADLNGDGKVNVFDLIILKRYLAD